MDEIIGVIKMFCGHRSPQNFYLCEGQLLAIKDFPALFAVIGNTFGGDGRHNFALPDFRSTVNGIKTWEIGKPKYIICAIGIYPSYD